VIHCLKTNLHTHTDELAGTFRRWHSSSYPVAELLRLFERKGFEAVAITEHDPDSAVESNDLAEHLIGQGQSDLIQLKGREIGIGGFHVVELSDGDEPLLRILCHPVRTYADIDLVETAARFRDEHGIEAVELDMLASADPSIRAQYERLGDQTDVPVICNSDFHTELFQMSNHFTVYLCEERTPEAVLRALRTGAYVGFYPDLASWEMQRWIGRSPLAHEWVQSIDTGRFSHRIEDFADVDPPVRLGRMTVEQILAFHGCEGIVLREGELSMLVLPDRGGRVAGIWIDGVQMADPILNLGLDVESSAEVYEAGFSAHEITEHSDRAIVLERRIVDRPEFEGIVYRKSYSLEGGEIRLSSNRRNTSRRAVALADHLRFRFFKDYGRDLRIEMEKPGPEVFETPVNAKPDCQARCRLAVIGEKYRMGLDVEDERLDSVSLWARAANAYGMVILNYRENVLAPGAESHEYAVTLRPARTDD
jgi:hypothetical protein